MRDRFDPLRRIPLTAVLRACEAQPDRYDKAKWHTSEGTISITGTKFMNWHCSHGGGRSEEHTSELQSQSNLVCRLLLEKKKNKTQITVSTSTDSGMTKPTCRFATMTI